MACSIISFQATHVGPTCWTFTANFMTVRIEISCKQCWTTNRHFAQALLLLFHKYNDYNMCCVIVIYLPFWMKGVSIFRWASSHVTDIEFKFLMNILHNNLPVICTWPCGCILNLLQIRAEFQPANRPAAGAVCSHSAGTQMFLTSKHGHQQL